MDNAFLVIVVQFSTGKMTKKDKIRLPFTELIEPVTAFITSYRLTSLDSLHLVATLKEFEIFHEFSYFVSILAMISFGHNCTTLI